MAGSKKEAGSSPVDENYLNQKRVAFLQKFFQTEDTHFNDLASKLYAQIGGQEWEYHEFTLQAFQNLAHLFISNIRAPIAAIEHIEPAFDNSGATDLEEIIILQKLDKFLKAKMIGPGLLDYNNLKVLRNLLKQEIKKRQTNLGLKSPKGKAQIQSTAQQEENKPEIESPKNEIGTKSYGPDISEKRRIIESEINSIDKEGWKYSFNNQQDYQSFVGLLINFFGNMPNSPSGTIMLKKGCKTRFASALRTIHKELSPSSKLTSDKEFIELLKILSIFKETNNTEIYKVISR